MNKKMKANAMLLLAAIIWGVSFVSQVTGMEYLGPFSFNGIRLILGGTALIPVWIFFSKKTVKSGESGNGRNTRESAKDKKMVYIGGLFCGLALFVASSLQQIGLQYTTAGKAAFITTMYVVFVPIFSFVLFKKKVPLMVWVSVAIATVGLYLLSIKGGFRIEKGDFLILLCAVAFTGHILVISHFSPKVDGIKMSSIQFYVAGVLSLIVSFFTEVITLEYIYFSMISILYSGIMSAGVGYTLQIVAQKDTDPAIASLLLSLESVFAVIAGALLLSEVMTAREIVGCVVMFIAIVISQLADAKSTV